MGLILRVSNLVDLRRDPIVCISNKFPGKVDTGWPRGHTIRTTAPEERKDVSAWGGDTGVEGRPNF